MLANCPLICIAFRHHPSLDAYNVKVFCYDSYIRLAERSAIGVNRRHGEFEGGVIDTRKICTATGPPGQRVLSERVHVHVLARSAVEVLAARKSAPVQRSASLLALATVKLDNSAGDCVITLSAGTLKVEVIVSINVGLFLDNPVHAGNGVVEHNLRGNAGTRSCLGVEVAHLDVLDEVLVSVGGEQAALHRVEVHEVGHQATTGDFTVEGTIEGGVTRVRVHEKLRLGAKGELHTDVVVLKGDNGESLGAALGEVKRKLDVQLDDLVAIGVKGVTVFGPVDELLRRVTTEHELVHVAIDVTFNLPLHLHVETGGAVDFVITYF